MSDQERCTLFEGLNAADNDNCSLKEMYPILSDTPVGSLHERLSALLLLVLLIIISNSSSALLGQPTRKTLTNEDVIAMSKAGLSDKTIIGLIETSPLHLDVSPDALMTLKTEKISDVIIEQMVKAGGTPPPRAADSGTAPQDTLPTSFGIYAVGKGQLITLRPVSVVMKIGIVLRPSGQGVGVDGLSNEPSSIIQGPSPEIIFYQQNVDMNQLHFASLQFVSSMQAGQFNFASSNIQFFEQLYGKSPTETVPVALWRRQAEIGLNIQPVTGRQWMFRITPTDPLRSGRYALFVGDALHPSDMILSANNVRPATAIHLQVAAAVRSSAPASRGGPEAGTSPRLTGGVLYLAKSDGTMIPLITQEASLRWAFGAKKTVDVNGVKSNTRFSQNDKSSFLASTPPMNWANTSQYKVYVFEVKNGKRTAVINKTGLTCSVESFGSASQFVKIILQGDLAPGEYAFGPSDPHVPNGGGAIAVITFGVDPGVDRGR